jgi:hypothetical protein
MLGWLADHADTDTRSAGSGGGIGPGLFRLVGADAERW